MSLIERWDQGFLLALMALGMFGHGLITQHRHTPIAFLLWADVTAIGVAMGLIGIPTVTVVLSIVSAVSAWIVLDRGRAISLSAYVLAWALAAYLATNLRSAPTVPANAPELWIAAATLFGVAFAVTAAVQLVETVRQLDETRTQLLAGVAHDVRNPLTAIAGAAALLANSDTTLDEDDRIELASIIVDQASEANRMVADLLVTARIDAMSFDVESTPIDIGNAVDEVLALISLTHPDMEVDFSSPDQTVMATGDTMRVRQILHNLLSNADRYGGRHVAVRIAATEGSVAISITDDGEGVPEAEREHIFEPFTRASTGTKVNASVGLGLSVARRLARLMAGELTYQRTADSSVFELTLPAAAAVTEVAPGPRIIETENARVTRVNGGLVRVDYGSAGRFESGRHASEVLDAMKVVCDGEKVPLMVVPGRALPDSDARKLYVEKVPTMADRVAIVTGNPYLTGFASLIADRMTTTTPIRVFGTESEAGEWLRAASEDVPA